MNGKGRREDSEVRMAFSVFPPHTNHYRTLFGGTAMAWMDQAAFICATRFCRRNVVTVHTGAIDFHQPVAEGSVVEVVARVLEVGRTSLRVCVEMFVEPLQSTERLLVCQGTFVLVAVDAALKPVPLATP